MAVRNWDPTPYPDSRARNALAAGGVEGGIIETPRARVWSASIIPTLPPRHFTLVSPRFLGPGIIRSIRYLFNVSDSAVQQTGIGLLVSGEGGGQGAAAITAALPLGVSLINGSTINPNQATMNNQFPNLLWLSFLGSNYSHTIPLGYVVTLPEWYLKLVFVIPGAGTPQCFAEVTLFEGVDSELVPDLLGA